VHALRYRLSGATWDELLGRLAALGHRAAIVGPRGHGKTTLVETLALHLEERGFTIRRVTLHEGDRCLTPDQEQTFFRNLTPRDCLVLDGAEQLAARSWRRVERGSHAAGGLVVTSHRAGLLPTLIECRTMPELLAGLVRDLLGDQAEELRITPEELFLRHGGNLRDAMRELYDWWAER
jgi:energy-coupling factor transporter ATP-binding protein EcfA2